MTTKLELQERLAIVQATLRDFEAKYKAGAGLSVSDLNMLERGIAGLHAEHTEIRNALTKLADDELAGAGNG